MLLNLIGSSRVVVCVLSIGLTTTLPQLAQGAAAQVVDHDKTINSRSAHITFVREFADGRFLMIDGKEHRLITADFRGGKARGQEVTTLRGVKELTRGHEVSQDSTLIEDRQSAKWILLVRAREVARVPSWSAGWRGPTIAGVDRLGRLLEVHAISYGVSPGTVVMPIQENADSLIVLLHFRNGLKLSGRVDTVARLRGRWGGQRTAVRSSNGHRTLFELRNPLAVEEQALLFPDGWIALALTEPFRVDWISPTGSRILGRPISHSPIPLDDVQKRQLVRQRFPTDPQLFGPGDFPPWPKHLPPFLNDALSASPDGNLVISRTRQAGSARSDHDVVNRKGRVVHRISLGPSERLIGFGIGTVLVAAKDADGLETLKRYPWQSTLIPRIGER